MQRSDDLGAWIYWRDKWLGHNESAGRVHVIELTNGDTKSADVWGVSAVTMQCVSIMLYPLSLECKTISFNLTYLMSQILLTKGNGPCTSSHLHASVIESDWQQG